MATLVFKNLNHEVLSVHAADGWHVVVNVSKKDGTGGTTYSHKGVFAADTAATLAARVNTAKKIDLRHWSEGAVTPVPEVPAPTESPVKVTKGGRACGGRVGTAYASVADLIAVLGDPEPGCDDKTTMEWHLETPHGTVGLWDYYWNAPGEWSLAGNTEGAKAVASFLKEKLGDKVTFSGFDAAVKIASWKAIRDAMHV